MTPLAGRRYQAVGASIAVVLLLLGAVLAGCGQGASEHVNMSDPRAVARAYAIAEYRCGDEGAGVRYDLSITTSPHARDSRDAYIEHERTHGCEPKPIPRLLVACGPSDGDITLVEVDAGAVSGVMTLRRLEDGTWRVDTYASDTNALGS